jgi:hypothetical protein
MDEKSTTPGDNPTNGDGAADATTSTDPQPGTETQPADKGDNLDDSSKSTDDTTPADGDTKPADDSKSDEDKLDDTPASQLDEDLDEWIESRKAPKPTTDAERQAYQDLRNEQRDYTREQQAKKDAADLAKTIDADKDENTPDADEDEEDDELEKTVKELKADRDQERTTRLQSEFYQSNKVTPDEHKQILDLIKEKVAARPTKESKLAALNLWGSPEMLPDLLDMAKARIAKTADTSTVADEAAQAERERIAKESNAKSPSRSASTTTTSDKTEEQARQDALRDRYTIKK